MSRFSRIAVAGAGAWGTALAIALARAGRTVTLWARDQAQAEAMASQGENRARLPRFRLGAEVAATAELSSLAGAGALLVAVPAQAVRGVCTALAPIITAKSRTRAGPNRRPATRSQRTPYKTGTRDRNIAGEK